MSASGGLPLSLSLFAEAIAGHPVSFTIVEDSLACWPWSSALGSRGSDLQQGSVLLPPAVPHRTMYRALVLHQLFHDRSVLAGLGGSEALFVHIHGLVEDHRVIAASRTQFPGNNDALDRLLRASRSVESTPGSASSRGFPEASAPYPSAPLAGLRRHVLGAGEETNRGDADPSVLRTAIQMIDEVAVPGSTARFAVEVARRITVVFGGDPAPRRLTSVAVVEDEEPSQDPGMPTDGTSGISLDGGTPSEFVERDGFSGGQLLDDSTGDLTTTKEPGEIDDAETATPGLRLATAVGEPARRDEARTFFYDEWDHHTGRYRPGWCRLAEEQLHGEDESFIDDVRARHQALRTQIRRRLLAMPPRDLVRIHRSLDGEELDLDAAIEARADGRAGAPVDDRLQIRRDRAGRDVATAFLVDLSASTSSPAVPPEPTVPVPDVDPFDDPMSYTPPWQAGSVGEPVRRVIDVAKDAVALMGDALHELGDRYAIYGFSGTGRDGVEFKVGKDFAHRSTPATWAAVGAMKPLRYTRMGPAVRHSAMKLARESARTKLLIVISDGYPQDIDYGVDRNDREYGMYDTARALAEATAAGIETFCVTIDPAGHDYLRDMCPDDRYLVIDDVESLPEELANLYLFQLRR